MHGIIVGKIDEGTTRFSICDIVLTHHLTEFLRGGRHITEAHHIKRLIGETEEITTSVIRLRQNHIDTIVSAFLDILFHREDTTLSIRLQTAAHTTVRAIGPHQITTGNLLSRFQSGNNLPVLFLKTLERSLLKGATNRYVLLQQIMVEMLTLNDTEGLLGIKLAMRLVVNRKTDMSYCVIIIMETRH